MRAKNYSDQTGTFTPLQPHQMVRVALVEGLDPKYEEPERQRYRRLLKFFSGADEERIDQLFRIIKDGPRSQREARFLEALIDDVAYNSGAWKPFDYDALKREGVVVEFSGDLGGLVQKVLDTDERRVILVRDPGWLDSRDYIKHIDWRNKLVINGYDVVIRFAQEKGFELPESFSRSRRMTEEVYRLLEQHGFTYTEALKTAIAVLKDPKYADRAISALVIKNPNGSELRMHPLDFVEAAELFAYAVKHRIPIKQTLGDLLEPRGDRYHGLNRFIVPKRLPEGMKRFDSVETHYLPDLTNPERRPLEWMNTVALCDCGNALNLRNFEERRGRRTYVVHTFDTHAGIVVLEIQRQKDINANQNPDNLNPLPTPGLLRFVDKLRYNVAQETEVQKGDKTKVNRATISEVGMEILTNELAKLWTFEQMYSPSQKISRFVLRPMY